MSGFWVLFSVSLEPLLNQLLRGIMTDRLLKFSPSIQTCNYCVLRVDRSSDWVWNSGFELRENSPLFPASDAADNSAALLQGKTQFFYRETSSHPLDPGISGSALGILRLSNS